MEVMNDLSEIISGGSKGGDKSAKKTLSDLFGTRYHERYLKKTGIRDIIKFGDNESEEQYVPFAGLINRDNPESGPYGGTSLVWFPTKDSGSIIGLGVGTRGLSPDEGILTRPGHRRRVAALRRYLAKKGAKVWSKPDPANLGAIIPNTAIKRFAGFEKALNRYGREMYFVVKVPNDDPSLALEIVKALFDLYSYERGWEILSAYKQEREDLLGLLRQDLFQEVTPDLVYEMLKLRRFAIVEGPPGTGKTRLAEEIKKTQFANNGMTIQFHPSVTYEDFLIGLSPDIDDKTALRFDIKPGWLLKACENTEKPFILVIDEINRAELGKILGEAIYLFEPDEIGKREIELPHKFKGGYKFKLPDNLYVLGTMNTADRSIAAVDIAIRRRFSFIKMMPDRKVVANQKIDLATTVYDQVSDAFIEHAPIDALNLIPGHSYYLAKSELELKKRFQYELLPLLDEYIRDGQLGPATTELNAVRDHIDDIIR